MAWFFAQSGTISDRFAGIRSQIAQDDFDGAMAAAALSVLFLGGVIFLISRRFFSRYVFLKEMQRAGLTATAPAATLARYWKLLPPEFRSQPSQITESPERFTFDLEYLWKIGEGALIRPLHEAWLNSIGKRVHLRFHDLSAGEHLRVVSESGELLAEGLVRSVAGSSITFLPYDSGSSQATSHEPRRVFLERLVGRRTKSRLEPTKDPFLWLLLVGIEAEVGHRRADFRIQTDSGAMLFPFNWRLRETREFVLSPPIPKHHLLVEYQKKNPPNYPAEFEKKCIWNKGSTVQLENLSVGGARIRTDQEMPSPSAEAKAFLFLSHDICGKGVHLLLPIVWLDAWTPHTSPEGVSWFSRRVRFDDLRDAEVRDLRLLMAQLTRAKSAPTSSVRERIPG